MKRALLLLLLLSPVSNAVEKLNPADYNIFKDVYHDPEILKFEGQQSYTAEQIKKCLGNSAEYWAAAHRHLPAQNFPSVVRRLVKAGYLHAGFPDVEVSVEKKTKDDIFRVRIKEGQRYTCGDIIIASNEKLSIYNKLRKVIVSPPSGNESPYISVAWKMNEPAPMDEALNPLNFEQNINNFLADLGSNLKGEVKITRQANRQVADMHVSFKPVKDPQTLGGINVSGSEKNSREDVLDYLQIKPGIFCDDGLEVRLEKKLRQSARFLKHDIWFENGEASNTKIMHIQLHDYDEAPSLSQNLSKEDEAIVKFFGYLENKNNWDKDIVIKLNTNTLDHETLQSFKQYFAPLISPSLEMAEARIILSNEGLLFNFLEGNQNGPSDLIAAMGYSPNAGFGLFLPGLQKKYRAESQDMPNSTGGFTIMVSMHPIPEPGENDRNFTFTFGAGFTTQNQNSLKELLTINIAPVTSIAFLRGEDTETEINDGYLTIKKAYENMESIVKLDLTTNTLVSLEVRDPFTSHLILEASMQDNALEESMKKIVSKTKSISNSRDSANRFGSFLALVVEWISPVVFPHKDQTSDLAKQAEILGGLVSKTGLLVERTLGSEEKDSFDLGRLDWSEVTQVKGREVPVRSMGQKKAQKIRNLLETAGSGNQSPRQTTPNPLYGQMLAMFLFEVKDDLFPRGSWPWIMAIESMLIHERELLYSEEFLIELCKSDQIGPIGCAIASYLLETSGSNRVMDCALKGLGKLSTGQFEKDYAPIIAPVSAVGMVLSELAQFCAQLDPKETKLLQKALETLPSVSQAVQKLGKHSDKPALKTFHPEMDNLWDNTVKQMTKDYLQSRVFSKTRPKIYTTLPGIDLTALTAKQKNVVLNLARREKCPCGCKLTIAVCRNEDSSCKTSVGIAEKIVESVTQVR